MYGHLASTQPTVSMRVDKLKLPGKEGGCAAVEVAWMKYLQAYRGKLRSNQLTRGTEWLHWPT